MNRHEKRLKLQRRLAREKEKIKEEGVYAAVNIIQILPCYVLSQNGFGNVRLQKFIEELHKLTKLVAEDTSKLEIIVDEIAHDKGIKFDLKSGEVQNLWRVENDERKVIRGKKKRKEVKK